MPDRAHHRDRAPLRPTPATPAPASAPSAVREAIASPGAGEALPLQVAGPIGASLGVDVAPVRLHTGPSAARAADAASARAFTWGTNIFLGTGQQATDLGLIGHEAAHVVQQQGAPAIALFTPAAGDALEHEARSASAAIVAGRPTAIVGHTAAPAIQRDWLPAWARRGVEAVKSGVSAVAGAVGDLAAAARDRALAFVKDKAKVIPGYDLLAFVLGKDPISQQAVDRNPINLIKALLSLIPGGAAVFDNLQKAGVIQRAYDWTVAEIAKLGLTWTLIRGLFQQFWDSLSASDLLNLGGVFDRVRTIFGPPLERIKDFAIAAGKKVLEFIFEGALALGGAAAQRVLGIFRRIGAVFDLIVQDPVKFVGNLVAAVKGGFQNFAANIIEHLKTALFEWLLGALKGAIQLPAKWDFMGIISVVLQVLGLTYDALRERLVKLIGAPAVKAVETAFEFLKLIVTKGLPAAWEKLLEFASGLVDTVISGIRDWAAKSIVGAAITKLVTLFNPVGAIIQSVIAIYNTIMFFIERAQQIAALVESIITSVENIAKGNLANAIAFVEKTMARTLPVIISFLARFIGLGNVSGAVKDIIAKIQGVVSKALDKVTEFIVKVTKPIVAALRGGAGKPGETPPAAGAAAGALPDKPFEAEGQKHRLFFRADGAKQTLVVASGVGVAVGEFLTDLSKSATDAQKADIKTARDQLAAVDKATVAFNAKPTDTGLRQKLTDAEIPLAQTLGRLLAGVPLDKLLERYKFEGVTDRYGSIAGFKGDQLEGDHQPQKGLLWHVAQFSVFLDRRVRTVIAPKDTVLGGMAINLNVIRHRAGRTWGGKSQTVLTAARAKVDAIKASTATDDDKRARILGVVESELAADIAAIKGVIARGPDDEVWGDVKKAVPGNKPEDDKKRRSLIARVFSQVTSGEERVRGQGVKSYGDK